MRYETWTGWGRFAVIGLLAVVMAACGGNGGGTTTGGDTTPPPVNMDALNAAKDAAMAAYDMAKKAVADVEAHKDADMDAYTTAVTKRDEAEAANTKAQAAETVADAENYQKMAEDANAAAMKYAEMVTDAADMAEAVADAAARAEKIAPAIARPNPSPAEGASEFDNMIDRNSPNCSDPAACADNRLLMVDGNKVSTTGADAKKFTMSSDAPPMLMGFEGSVHTRADRETATATMPRVTDEVTVYTNQEDPTPTPFSGGENGVYTLNTGGAGTADDPNTALTISATITDAVTMGKNGTTVMDLVSITQHRPSAGTSTITFGKDSANTIKSLSGTFDMAPGTYECATTCMATINTDGKLTVDIAGAGAATVTFVPASGAMVPAPDTDYLTFGYWVQTSTDMEDEATTMIAPFATGKGTVYSADNATTYAATITSGSTVSATYTGPATGMFVHKTDVDGDGKGLVPTSSGQFTAEANLTANFTNSTDGDLGTNYQNAIHGKVSNFMNSSTGQMIEGWELTLDPAKFAGNDTTFDANARGGFTFGNTTSGGKDAPAGGWRGSFYGPSTAADGTTAIQPGSVAGEFLGHFANGHAVGAFGATKTKE